MTVLEIYDELVKLRNNPAEFDRRVDEIWKDFYKTLSPDSIKRAEQYRWTMDAKLAKCKTPQERYNKMVELFWNGVKLFKASLDNPSSLIAKSQDGKNIVVISPTGEINENKE